VSAIAARTDPRWPSFLPSTATAGLILLKRGKIESLAVDAHANRSQQMPPKPHHHRQRATCSRHQRLASPERLCRHGQGYCNWHPCLPRVLLARPADRMTSWPLRPQTLSKCMKLRRRLRNNNMVQGILAAGLSPKASLMLQHTKARFGQQLLQLPHKQIALPDALFIQNLA
jgi:hypothetical protein